MRNFWLIRIRMFCFKATILKVAMLFMVYTITMFQIFYFYLCFHDANIIYFFILANFFCNFFYQVIRYRLGLKSFFPIFFECLFNFVIRHWLKRHHLVFPIHNRFISPVFRCHSNAKAVSITCCSFLLLYLLGLLRALITVA